MRLSMVVNMDPSLEPEIRRASFHEELEAAETALLSEGSVVARQLELVMDAVERQDLGLAHDVIAGDDEVDRIYLENEERILNLLALQAPVARDLRLVSAILHSNLHLERMGDLCVNIAKFVRNDHSYPADSPMVSRLQEMGARLAEMLEVTLSAFAQRSQTLAEELPERDLVLNRLNRGMLDDLKAYAGDEEAFEWATNIVLVARYLERFGDHCVDVGEQISFLVTGVFREFTDASK
ncbi:MAG: phosphate signaling complex protein PhoU [Actinobacteria bacterium]|nr:phosphate signaling complex protein PhoU [Actinomycetota bacterium]